MDKQAQIRYLSFPSARSPCRNLNTLAPEVRRNLRIQIAPPVRRHKVPALGLPLLGNGTCSAGFNVREKRMRAYRLFGVVAIAGLVSVAFSGQSNALTLTLDQNVTSSFPTISIGFQAPNFTIGPTTVDFPTTSSPGEFRSPWDIEGAPHNSLPYTSVRGGTAGYNLTGNVLSLFGAL